MATIHINDKLYHDYQKFIADKHSGVTYGKIKCEVEKLIRSQINTQQLRKYPPKV